MTTAAGGGVGAPQQPVTGGMALAMVRLLRRRRVVIVAVTVGAVLAAALAVTLWPPPYEARAVLQLQTPATGSLENVSFDLLYTDRLLSTYLELAESDQIHDEVVARLGVDQQVTLKTSVPGNTELLVVAARAAEPELATRAADTLADVLSEEIRRDLGQRFDAAGGTLEQQVDEIERRIEAERSSPSEGSDGTLDDLLAERDELIRSSETLSLLGQATVGGVSTVQEADVPSGRATSPVLLVIAAGLLGLAGAFAVALLVDRLDRTVFDVGEAVAAKGHVVLGEVRDRSVGSDPASVEFAPLDPQAVRVAFGLRESAPRSLLFTSPFARPSTPILVADLTRALASTGNGLDVVAVDAAFDPVLHAALGTPDRPGLHEALLHEKPLAELAIPARHPRVHLVPGGTGEGARSRLIDAFWVLNELKALNDVFDLVVVHAPPLLGSADASLLARSVEGTVLILEDGQLHEADLDEALAQAAGLPSAFLGVVVARPGPARTRRPSFRRRRGRRA